MGGCPMGDDPERSVADTNGKVHQLENLYIMDGSLFPTSIGANPQLSIYGLVYKLSSGLAAQFQAALVDPVFQPVSCQGQDRSVDLGRAAAGMLLKFLL